MDKTKSTASSPSKSTMMSRRVNIRMAQNVHLILLYNNYQESNVEYQNMITQLRCITNILNIFTDTDQCIDFLTDIPTEKVCMIISDTLCENTVRLIHDITQLYTIFIFDENGTIDKQWTRVWFKIKGIFTEISTISEALKEVVQQCEQNDISISFVDTNSDISNKSLDQLDPSFMYTQILKEILLSIHFKPKHLEEFINHCHNAFTSSQVELSDVKKLIRKYYDQTSIWWYTCEWFLYSTLNHALRLMNVDTIIKMGCFIRDLHRDIEQLYKEQFNGHSSVESFTVYRGQGMSKTDFDQMMNTKGGLISFNNFLSTSKDRDFSFAFAESSLSDPNLVGVLFVMTIDPSISSIPFASVAHLSKFSEEAEILFSMHTIFRIRDIKPIRESRRLFQVNLVLTNDNDKDLSILMKYIRNETLPQSEGWCRMGQLLLKMGEFDKSQQVYDKILEETTDENRKVFIYNQIGQTKYKQGEYKEAIALFEKALENRQRFLSPDHPTLYTYYLNIGVVYHCMGEYSKELSYCEKALKIQQQSLPPNHLDLGASYNNIGLLYFAIGEFSQALSFFEKAFVIRQELLPSNHPDLGASYNNIGLVYFSMNELSKALSNYEKSLQIQQQSLPPNHPDLAMSYSNIGVAYIVMGKPSKALSNHEKALQIRQQVLPSNHPDLGASYNNIGKVYSYMDVCSKALSFHEKALQIQQRSLPPNHPDLAICYYNIGIVYFKTREYSKALLFHEKSLQIRQESLPSNHFDVAMSHYNIGTVYYKMGDYPKSLSSHEKALHIQQQILSPDHPNLRESYDNIGDIHMNMRNYSKALLNYENVIQIQHNSLPPYHINLCKSYDKIGFIYAITREYSKSLLFLEKMLLIYQKLLPPKHPTLSTAYMRVGEMYAYIGEHSKALSYYEKAQQIQQQCS